MIRSFADKETRRFFEEGRSKKYPAELQRRMLYKLTLIDAAVEVEDLRVPPSNRLHALKGDRKGQWSVSVNDKWRVCFRFRDKSAYDVEICDYH